MKNKEIFPRIALLFFLITGLIVFDDYGLAWDEYFQLNDNGHPVWNYVSSNDFQSYEKNPEKYHGPAFEIVLVAIEKISGVTDSREIYLQRHLISFLFYWISGLALYLLLRKKHSNPLIVTIGIVWYFLMPRIFADSFYNTKDIPFLAMNMVCLYSMYRMLENFTVKWAIIHGVFSGFMIAIRIMGIIIPVASVMALLFYVLFYRIDFKKLILPAGIYTLVTFLTTVIFWPILWMNPIHHLIEAWNEMSKYPWASTVLYRGNFVDTLNLPWHYSLTWIGITIPIIYFVFLLIKGCILIANIKLVFKERILLYDYILASLLIVIVISVVALNSIMYDGWRHLFFIYAPMCVLMVSGFEKAFDFFKTYAKVSWLLIPVFAITFYIGYQMINLHPYQNIYFNRLIGKNSSAAVNNYELDYWGTSYREALEKLAVNDTSKKIMVHVSNAPGIMNSWILKKQIRERFEFVSTKDSADYFITNYRWETVADNNLQLTDSIVVDGARISGTYWMGN